MMAEAMPHPHHNIVSPWALSNVLLVILGPLDYVLAERNVGGRNASFPVPMIRAVVSPPPSFGNHMAGSNIGEAVPG